MERGVIQIYYGEGRGKSTARHLEMHCVSRCRKKCHYCPVLEGKKRRTGRTVAAFRAGDQVFPF